MCSVCFRFFSTAYSKYVASFLSMVCIAFDRHHNLVRTGRKRMTHKRVALLIAWVWTQSSVVATPWNELIKSDTSTNISACALVKTLPLLLETGPAFSTLSAVFKITSLLFPLLGIYCISFPAHLQRRTSKAEGRHSTPLQHSTPFFTDTIRQPNCSSKDHCDFIAWYLHRFYSAISWHCYVDDVFQ